MGTWLQKWDDNELGMMEAVVTKMSRIIAHVSSGEKGSHVLQKLQVRRPKQQEVRVITLDEHSRHG